MTKSDRPSITTEQFWQMLELVASPECDADTDELAEALGMIANETQEAKEEGIGRFLAEMNSHLPGNG